MRDDMNEEGSWMPPEAYINIAAGIVDVARQVADPEFQQRVWINDSEPGVMSSYEEGVLGTLGDYGVHRAVNNAAKYGFSEHQAEKLRLFVMHLTHFADQHPGAVSQDVVGSSDWSRVQRAAADFIEAIDAEAS